MACVLMLSSSACSESSVKECFCADVTWFRGRKYGLGMVAFCVIAAFTPEWRRVAVIWAVFFAYSLAIGRILSLIVDGMPSAMLLFYLAVELVVGTWGLFVLARERR